jgi:polyisoprenoid-binding protein YceI
MLKRPSLIALFLLLAACAAPMPRVLPPPAPRPLEAMPAAGVYQIDPQHSELRLLVYRAGPLANFGHNHVMVNRSLSGTLRVGQSIETSGFVLSIPVAQFSVDDAGARRAEGEDFSGEVSEGAREGTLRNMLSAPLLNAESYPTIEIRSEQLQETHGSLNAIMAIDIAGRGANIAAPFTIEMAPGGLGATASFEVRQTELGLTPMSLLGGALQVRDAIQIKLTLTAVPAAAT